MCPTLDCVCCNNVDPVSFNWKSTGIKSYGYIAQNILSRSKMDALVTCTSDDTIDEYVDADGMVSAKGVVLSVAYDKVVSVLHAALRTALAKIDTLTELHAELRTSNAEALARIERLEKTCSV